MPRPLKLLDVEEALKILTKISKSTDTPQNVKVQALKVAKDYIFARDQYAEAIDRQVTIINDLDSQEDVSIIEEESEDNESCKETK